MIKYTDFFFFFLKKYYTAEAILYKNLKHMENGISKKLWKNGFTLVELVVVVTILSILATVGFVSYSSYISGVRDTNRISSLTSLSDWLELHSTKFDLPIPDNSVEVYSSGKLIGYQGYAGKNVLQTVEFTKGWKDPQTDQYFTYYVTANKAFFQMLSFLETDQELETAQLLPTMNAMDYSNKSIKLAGRKLGILTDINKTPIQEISTIKENGLLDIKASGETFVLHFKDNWSLTGSWEDLNILTDLSQNGWVANDCLNWILINEELRNKEWYYQLIDENGHKYEWYCDGLWNELITDSPDYVLVADDIIENGDFSWGTDILTESGSVDDNTIIPDDIPYENDGDDDYQDGEQNEEDEEDNGEWENDKGHSLHQEWDDSVYKVEVDQDKVDDLNDKEILRICAWVKNKKSGGYIFNNILEYHDGRKEYNGGVKNVEDRYIKGKKWTYQCVERVINGNPKSFVLNLWYKAQVKGKDIYISGVDVKVFKHKND